MNSARCKTTKEIYTADQFQLMSEFEREKLKGNLECEECLGEAHFVRKKRNGRKPCFGAKHKKGCDSKSKGANNGSEDDLEPVNMINAREDQFKIKSYNYMGNLWSDKDTTDENDEDFDKKGTQKRTHVFGSRGRVISKRTLPQILKICLDGVLKDQEYEIELSDGKFEHIKNCVHELKFAEAKLYGKYGYYWGYVVHATGNWLNTNTKFRDNPSYLISDEIAEDFWNYIRIKPHQWDRPIPIIAKGKLKKSQNDKLYVEVASLEHIYISTRDFKDAFSKRIKVK